MVYHKEQRVGVFVDVQNLYYSAKNLYQQKVNFKEILKEAVKGRQLVRAFAYVIKADMKDEDNFHKALTDIGFEVKAKELQVFYGGNKKGDWDVGIAMDMVRMADKIDTAVLISGDGDFDDLLMYMQANGCRAEVLAFAKSCSIKLKNCVDSLTDMDLDTKRFLQPKKIAKKGFHKHGQQNTQSGPKKAHPSTAKDNLLQPIEKEDGSEPAGNISIQPATAPQTGSKKVARNVPRNAKKGMKKGPKKQPQKKTEAPAAKPAPAVKPASAPVSAPAKPVATKVITIKTERGEIKKTVPVDSPEALAAEGKKSAAKKTVKKAATKKKAVKKTATKKVVKKKAATKKVAKKTESKAEGDEKKPKKASMVQKLTEVFKK